MIKPLAFLKNYGINIYIFHPLWLRCWLWYFISLGRGGFIEPVIWAFFPSYNFTFSYEFMEGSSFFYKSALPFKLTIIGRHIIFPIFLRQIISTFNPFH